MSEDCERPELKESMKKGRIKTEGVKSETGDKTIEDLRRERIRRKARQHSLKEKDINTEAIDNE